MVPALDHDALFKQLLSEFLHEFLALCSPALFALLDPEPMTFLDKESFRDLLDPDRREADLVAQARLRGQPATFLIHLEHQAQADAQLDRRMFRYFARFYDRYNQPIYPIALCSYRSPRRQARDQHRVAFPDRTVLEFQYQVVQLNQLDWRDYLTSANPVAAALMARMAMTRQERWRVKAASFRLLAGLPLSGQRRRMLGQFVDLYLPLNDVEARAFQQELATLPQPTQEVLMDMVTSWERKGRAEGRAEGQREVVLRLLTRKVGQMPTGVEAQVEQLSPGALIALSEALLEFDNLTDLTEWLEQQAAR